MARGGKNWNLGFSDRSQDGVSDAQLRLLRSLWGKDFRGEGLTKGRASDLIEEGYHNRAINKSGLTDIAEAGDWWVAGHPNVEFVVATPKGPIGLHGAIGNAYITAPKKGSGLAKWIAEHGFNDRRNLKQLALHHRYQDRLEGELQLVCAIAALKVFEEAKTEIGGIRVVFRCESQDYKLPEAA
jgi:hypothetical protein